nr:anti-sigma factor [Solirubrobacterales bacterium]
AFGGYEIGTSGSGSSGPRTVAVVPATPSGVGAKVLKEDDKGEIRLADVQSLPQNRVLEAWVRRDGEVEPVKALFVPNGEGEASTTLGDLHGVDLVMVTTEPSGGSRAPTSAPLVEVPIKQS